MIDKLTALASGVAPWAWAVVFAAGLSAGVLTTRWLMAPLIERAQQKAAQCEADSATLKAARDAAQRRAADALAKAKTNAKRDAQKILDMQRGLAERAFRDTPADQALKDIHDQWRKQQP